MSLYKIKPYSFEQASKLNVTIKPSRFAHKKIDVFKNGTRIASIGHSSYPDYPTHILERGKAYADKRRIAYKKRHNKDRKKNDSNGYYADNILW
jgi:hypothetical protein